MRRLVFLTFLFSFLFAQTYDSEIQPIFNNNCTSCHGTSGNLDLSQGNSYTNLVNVASSGYSGFQRVKPGDPMNSVLHQKIVGNTSFGDRMPKGGSALAQADEEKIKNWIQNGAVKDWSGGAVSSYSFDFGPGPYIDVKAPIEGEQVWSIEAWVKFHQKPTTTDHEIFFLNNNANQNLLTYFFSPNSDKFRVELSGANALEASANEVFDTKFHHFYLEGNGSKIAIYIDGTNKAESDYTGSFPQSDKDMSIGYRLDASMDEIRFRKKSGFPGLPTARYNAEEGTWLLYQFDNQSTTQITDNSGQNNHGTIKGTAAYEDDVYASGGGGNQGINLTVTSNETLTNEEILVGFMGPGKDPNYWANRSWDHSLGNYTFPGSHQFLIPRSDLLDGNNYHLLVFADLNNDKILDDATEYKGTSMPFSISGGIGNAGTINLNAPGGGGTELYTDAVEIVFKSMAPHLAAVNLINTGNLWLAVYENENVKPIDALPNIPDNPIFKDRILDFDQNPVQNAIYTFKDENFQAIYDSGYAFVAWYNQDRYMGNDQTSNDFDIAYDPYSWGTFHVNRQSIEQGNKLKLEMHLHFIPGPEITPPSASSIQAIKGEELQLVFSASASQMTGSEVEQAQVEYRYGLESGIEWRIEMANDNGNGTWMATIPANHLTMGGLFVMYTAHDEMGVWSSSERYDIQVEFPDLAFEPHFKITTAETYEMISVPAVLQNYSSDAVLADELGGYDKKKWRLFKWSNGQYVESNVSFTPGAAYWLITKNGEQINTGPGKSTRIYSSSKISLFDGWNMVGNPYIFPINLVEHVGLSENVEPTLYEWNGSSYNNTTHMMPKGGNWVYSNGNGTMEFFPIWKPGLFSEVEVIPEETADEEDFNWKAKIITKAGNRYDKTATFGVHEFASDTWDRFDYHEPPVIGDYISMAFDNDSWTENGGSYSQDIRSEGRTQTWNLVARSNIKGIVSLNLEDIHDIPSHQDVRLVDPVLGIVYNLRSEKAVTFTSQGTENPYYFKLIVGAADDIQSQLDDMGMVPNDFELFQNTPNPFNPVTNIRVSLVEDARITLKVYNLLGKEVNTLALNQSLSKGNHRFIWAGKDDNGYQLPSGVYLYRIEINSHVGRQLYQSTKKMVLMK